MKISISRDEILDLEGSLKKEYLLTNGRGGYCSSSVLDCHRRKYHGLMVLPLKGQGKTFNLLSKIDVSVVVGKSEFLLATNKFPSVYFPTGHQYVDCFEMEFFPVTKYRIGDMEIAKSIIMPYGGNTVFVRYELLKSPKRIKLKAIPFLAYRDMNSLSKENINLRQRTFFEKNGFHMNPYDNLPPIYIQTSRKPEFFPSPAWWNDFEYIKEMNRGYEYQEDLFTPGVFEIRMKEGDDVIFRASIDGPSARIKEEWTRETERIKKEGEQYGTEQEPLRTLKVQSRAYLIENTNGEKGIIAGYHWFGEWGRDTLISLAGLTLCTGKRDTAFDILARYSRYEKGGLLPNFLSSDGNHAYNAVDTPLWFFRAVQQYMQYTGEREKVRGILAGTMKNIVRAFLENRVPLAQVKDDGLLYAGSENTQLTWMDAMVHGKPVTPRNGACVEINALWYNALCLMAKDFAGDMERKLLERIEHFISLFEENFVGSFWNDARCSLNDVFRPENPDISIRPNQLFAIGLPYTCVDRQKALAVIKTVRQHLVTPYGLRTLSPEDPLYKSDYRGDESRRDAAYHQGIIWPWLIGIYCDSLFAHLGDENQVTGHVLNAFGELWKSHLARYGFFHISEIFKPNPPHTAKGCIAQAWNAGEIIRVLDRIGKTRKQ